MKNIVVIGGGAAGFFAAISCAENHPDYHITILEKSSTLLQKVKISGGGRCNVTHACFEPKELVKFYPRGEKQLLGPFTKFNPADTIEWFENHGVKLKAEEDGRMFPVTDSSQTIIDCFMGETVVLGIKVKTVLGVEGLIPPTSTEEKWKVITNKNFTIEADAVIITTGSGAQMWGIIEKLGHSIVPAVPSLFTFNIKDERIHGLEGLSVENATIQITGEPKLNSTGPLLITHWGTSGPGILRLSAWGARKLAALNHNFEISLNWIGEEPDDVKQKIKEFKEQHPKKNVSGNSPFSIPKRLWERLVKVAVPNTASINYADLSNQQIAQLTEQITISKYKVNGKSTYKDEFVTAGGVLLDEIDFKTMQSKKLQGLYFAGEVLDIDAITGGFNFQAAWTTGSIAGSSC
ncbi:MAG: flavoprotein [Bacteroidota bacterium]|nr:flavoprotein [Bacteroidota bacterium]